MKKSEISENFGEISEKVGIYRKLSKKVGNFREKSDKRNFCAFFFSRLTEKRYFGEISAEKTEIFVHDDNRNGDLSWSRSALLSTNQINHKSSAKDINSWS